MPVAVLQKPKEKELVKGWRTKTRTKVIVKEKGVRERHIAAEKAKARTAAHNVMLIRVRGVRGPGEEMPGLVESVRGWLGKILGKRKQA